MSNEDRAAPVPVDTDAWSLVAAFARDRAEKGSADAAEILAFILHIRPSARRVRRD